MSKGLAALTELKGVGPATASAVLAAAAPDIPFMSDELLLVRSNVSHNKECRRASRVTYQHTQLGADHRFMGVTNHLQCCGLP